MSNNDPVFLDFFTYSPDLFCILDQNGYFLRLNLAWEKTLGFPAEALQTKPYLEWVHPQDSAATLAQLKRENRETQNSASPLLFENRYRCQDGSYKWLAWTAAISPEQDLTYLSGRDITPQKQTQAALIQAEATYRGIYENAVEGIFQTTVDGQYLRANPALARIYGYSSPDEMLTTLQDIKHQLYVDPQRREEFASLMQKHEIVVDFESAVYRADGSIIWIAENARAVRNAAGELLYYEGFVEDITKRKEVEAWRLSSEVQLHKQQTALIALAGCQSIYTGNLEEAWREITKMAAITLSTDQVSIWLYNSDHSKLSCVNLYSLRSDQHTGGTELLSANYPCYSKALEEERVIVADNAYIDLRTQEFANAYLTPFKIAAKLDATIRQDGKIVGVLCIEHIGSERHWTLEEQNFAGYLAYMATLALESYERAAAKAELEKSLSLLSATLESTADGILVIDGESNIVSFNQKFVELWKLPPSLMNHPDNVQILPLLKKQLQDEQAFLSCTLKANENPCLPGYDILELRDGRIFERYAQMQSIAATCQQNFTPVHQGIFPIHLSTHATPPHCSHPPSLTPNLWVWSFRDITERKKIERLKNEFVSMVSHELRTPLTSIRGSLSLLMGGIGGTLPQQAQALVEIALKNSERLVLLINDILDIEKIESGKMDFHLEVIDLIPLVEQALEANQVYGEQFGVNFTFPSILPSVKVKVDRSRFMQVMTNLLSNAAKFSPANGSVEISITRHCVSSPMNAASPAIIRVAVTDHGSGIPEEFRDRIFQKFAQADSSDTRQKGGTGLGLSISKAIIEKLGGTMGFETQIHQGTTFYFDLPEFSETLSPPLLSPPLSQISSPRILICEDDPDIATLLSLILKSGGFQTDIAYNTDAAKQLLGQKNYAAMTLDLAMPDQDGLSLIRELRAQDKTRHLPIVVVSAKAYQGREELNGGGFAVIDWINKPIDQDRLMAAVKQAALRRQSKPRILHVEDDVDVQQVIAMILHDLADIEAAVDLEQAKQKLAQDIFDLVILDFGLPDGSGLELLSDLNHPQRPPIPVVVFSAWELGQQVAKQVAAILVKSRTSNQELLETIKSLIVSNDTDNSGEFPPL